MEYIITYLLLVVLICLGIITPKSKATKFIIILMVFILMAFSQDTGDFFVYEREYETIAGGGTSSYEVLFVLAMQVGNALGLSYLQFRGVAAFIEIIVLDRFISKRTVNSTYVWTLYLIFAAIYNTPLLRFSMAMVFVLPALWLLLKEKRTFGAADVVKFVVFVSLAGLSHSSFWIFLCFLPFSMLNNKMKAICIIAGTFVVFLGSATNIIMQVYSLLPIREYTIQKYFTGSYANLNGLIFDCIAQALYIFPSVITWYIFMKRKDSFTRRGMPAEQREYLEQFVNLWLGFNILFCIIVPFQLIAVNFSRMQRILALINYIFISRLISIFPGQRRTLLTIGVVYATALLMFMTFIQSSTNIEYVIKPIFESNPFLNFFKLGPI